MALGRTASTIVLGATAICARCDRRAQGDRHILIDNARRKRAQKGGLNVLERERTVTF